MVVADWEVVVVPESEKAVDVQEGRVVDCQAEEMSLSVHHTTRTGMKG